MLSVEIKGVKEFMDAVKTVETEGKRTVGQMLLEAATMTHQFAINSIRQGARSGRLYRRWRGAKTHKASAPGEAPKSDTGTLVQNITLEKIGRDGYTVGSRKGAPHGFWLEWGTSMMDARPWLTPAFNAMEKLFWGKYK